MLPVKKLETILKKNGFSVTKVRLEVFSVLYNLNQPITIPNLIKDNPRIDKVSIYRTIDLFEKINVVHRIWTGFKSKIELSEEFSSHHHHFTCLNCGATINIESPKLERDLHNLESKYDFNLTHHSLELSGYCHSCKINLG